MYKNIITYLKGESDAFAGLTHILIAIMMFLSLFFIDNLIFFSSYVNYLIQNKFMFIVIFFLIAGASLLPDLDNNESTAKYQLGFIAILITIFMKITSSMIFTFTRMKNDKTPPSQHRYFWHSIFIAVIIILIFWYKIPENNQSVLGMTLNSNGRLFDTISDNFTSYICVFFAILSIKMGVNSTLWRFLKLIEDQKTQKAIPLIITILLSIFVLQMTNSQLRYIGFSIGLGYFFHNFADLFSIGSIPIIFPIPAFWKGQMWWKPKLPFQLMTNGFGNYILNWIVFLADCALLYLVITLKLK